VLHAIAQAGLCSAQPVPEQWVVDCRLVGRGDGALEYISRYLYRGVIRESNILADQDGQVSFRYTIGQTGQTCIETVPGEEFLWRVIQHVLPRGFHRVRDYGFLASQCPQDPAAAAADPADADSACGSSAAPELVLPGLRGYSADFDH